VACTGGTCVRTCNTAGYTYCPTINSCVNLTADATNCGACARVCPTGGTCTTSQCIMRYGYTTQFSGTATLSASYLSGVELDVPQAITVQRLAAIMSNNIGNAVLALYKADPDGTLRVVARTAVTALSSANGGRNEIPVITQTRITAGKYWVLGEFDMQAVIFMAPPPNQFPKIGTSVTFGGVPDPFPLNVSSATMGNGYNYYVIGAL
jgi:ferredoxin